MIFALLEIGGFFWNKYWFANRPQFDPLHWIIVHNNLKLLLSEFKYSSVMNSYSKWVLDWSYILKYLNMVKRAYQIHL